MMPSGQFHLVLYDGGGKKRAALDESGLTLFNNAEKVQARLDRLADKPRLAFFDTEGQVSYLVP